MYLKYDELKYLFADNSDAAMERLIRDTEYGKCVYCCDNDVPDHQCVSMEFEGGATVSHVMTGFTADNVRTTRISCTGGEILCDGDRLQVHRFDGLPIQTEVPEHYRIANGSRHGGGDFNLVTEMLGLLHRNDPTEIRTVTSEALASHVIAFAAERSRLEHGKVIELA